MVYYILTKAGLPTARIERIEGYADHKLQDAAHPLAAANRRIEILLQEPRR
jgi:chemotaxis protein MotB